MKRFFSLVLTLVISLFLNINSVQSQQATFKLGFLPSEKAAELTPKAEALAEFLEARLGMPVEIIIPTAYEPLIEGLHFGHLDAAFMDSGPAWLAHKKAGAEVVLAELKDGQPYYWGEVFVRSDSPITKLDEIIGKKIAFTSWTGSSGFVFPIGTLVKRGLMKPEGDDFIALEKALQVTFSEYVIAGGYKQALDLLVQGKVDVAAGAHDAAQKYLAVEDQGKIKPIERLGKVPSHPVMTRGNLEENIKASFVAAMLELNDSANNAILKNVYGVDGLVATTTQDHLGDFGPAFESLAGIHEKVLEKKE